MNRTLRLYGILFVIMIVVMGILEVSKKEITDWRKNYNPSEKSPFGLYVFDQEAAHLFGEHFTKTDVSPYRYYQQRTATSPQNILSINPDIDAQSWESLLTQVKKGSDLMLVTTAIDSKLLKKLNLAAPQVISFSDTVVLRLQNSMFQGDSLLIDKFPNRIGFKNVNRKSSILGTNALRKGDGISADFIAFPYGKGRVFIHTEPLFITNYYMLKKENIPYIQDVFSYLPDRGTVWFTESAEIVSTSVMRFVLSKPALRYAWWLFLFGAVVFICFGAKRKQRVVPIIRPKENKSAEFVKSIGNLYLQEGDFHDMMAKKAQYFLYRVRQELLIDTRDLNEEFCKRLHLKTQKNPEDIREAIALIKKGTDPYAHVKQEDLFRMNRLLDNILEY